VIKFFANFVRLQHHHGDALQGIDLFAGLTDQARNAIAAYLHQRSFAPQEMIYRQDAPSGACYFILQGSVELYRRGPEQQEERLRIVKSGQSFGVDALFPVHSRSHGARVFESCQCLTLTSADFAALKQNDPINATELLLCLLDEQLSVADRCCDEYLSLTRQLIHANIIV